MLNLSRLLDTIVKKNGHRKYRWDRGWYESFKKLQALHSATGQDVAQNEKVEYHYKPKEIITQNADEVNPAG